MATAATVAQAYDNTLASEGYLRMAHLTECSHGFTFTPPNSSGKTIRILSAYNDTTGSAVIATVATGVITFSEAAEGGLGEVQDVNILFTVT